MNREEITTLIEKYLDGDLNGGETQQFEESLRNSEELRRELVFQQQLRNDISAIEDRNRLFEKMNRFHSELKGQKKTASTTRKPLVQRFAVAASLAILVSVSSIAGYIVYQAKNNSDREELMARRQAPKPARKATNTNPTTTASAETAFAGTAFALSADGYFLSSGHIVGNNETVVLENPADSTSYEAKVISRDSKFDLVLLKIVDTSFKGLKRIPYGLTAGQGMIAQPVFTLGFPKDDIVFGEGTISALTGFNSDTLKYQLSIPVNAGQSGSPLFNEQGELMGIVSAKNSGAEAESYAVKSKYIIDFVRNGSGGDIKLPTGKALRKLPMTEKVKQLQRFVFIIRA